MSGNKLGNAALGMKEELHSLVSGNHCGMSAASGQQPGEQREKKLCWMCGNWCSVLDASRVQPWEQREGIAQFGEC